MNIRRNNSNIKLKDFKEHLKIIRENIILEEILFNLKQDIKNGVSYTIYDFDGPRKEDGSPTIAKSIFSFLFFNRFNALGIPSTISSAINPFPWFFAMSPCNHVAAHPAKNGFIFFSPTKLTIKPLRTSPDPMTANSEDVWLLITISLL